MSETVFVTNGDADDLTVSWCFNEYHFPVGQAVEVPAELAQFTFGHGEADKLPAMVRLGFVKINTEIKAGLARLAKYAITDAPAQQDRSQPSAVDVVPLSAARRSGGPLSQRAA